jgi:hypothetical protein
VCEARELFLRVARELYIALTKVAMGFADSHTVLMYAFGVSGERCMGCSLRKLCMCSADRHTGADGRGEEERARRQKRAIYK